MKIFKILVVTGIIVITSFVNAYTPRLELTSKTGNYRNLSRTSLLLPVFSNMDNLLYFNGIGMFDSRSAKEGNFGFGYRKLSSSSISGIFGHYDIRSSKYKKRHHQLTLGFEYFTNRFEYRINGYLPLSQKHQLSSQKIGEQYVIKNQQDILVNKQYLSLYDLALSGLDIEVGTRLFTSPIAIHTGYYHFGSGNRRVFGPRGRFLANLNHYLKLTGEIQYDKYRKLQGYIGLDMKVTFGHRQPGNNFSLHEKMLQMPVRDIDVVTVVANINTVKSSYHHYKIITNALELDAALKNMHASNPNDAGGSSSKRRKKIKEDNPVLLIAKDIDYSNNNKAVMLSPYGKDPGYIQVKMLGIKDEDHTKIVNANKDKSITLAPYQDNDEMRKISGYTIQEDELAGFFVRLENSLIANINFAGKGVIGSSNVGGVAGQSVNTVFNNVQNYTPIIANNAKIGGLVGHANGSTFVKCFNNGKISANNAMYVGGVAGAMNEGSIENSSNRGNIVGKNGVGGIVGNIADSEIRHSNNDGKIIGQAMVGGINGMQLGSSKIISSNNKGSVGNECSKQVGGIVGFAKGIISNSHNYAQIIGEEKVGGIAGVLQGKIEDSNNLGDIGNNSQGKSIGGISGLAQDAKILNVINKNPVKGEERVGGIIGSMRQTEINRAENLGEIIGTEHVGGIVGAIQESSNATNIINRGAVTGTKHTGGITGVIIDVSTIEMSENHGRVSGDDMVGGIAGMANGNILKSKNSAKTTGKTSVGGISGILQNGVIKDSQNTGEVGDSNGKGMIGGIVGQSVDSTISNSVNNGKVSGCVNVGGIVGESQQSQVDNCANRQEVGLPDGIDIGGIIGSMIKTKSVCIENSGNILGKENIGGIAGAMKYSHINRSINTGSVSSNGKVVGGIAGVAVNASINDSNNSAAITGKDVTSGILGYALEKSTIENVENTGKIIGEKIISGIVGTLNGSSLSKAKNTGEVKGETHVGGLVGLCDNESGITGVCNHGQVDGTNVVGGIVASLNRTSFITNGENFGKIGGGSNFIVGGVVGIAENNVKIDSSFNKGEVVGDEVIGGIVGSLSMLSSLENSYNNGSVGLEGSLYVGGIVGIVHDEANIVHVENKGRIFGRNNVGGITGGISVSSSAKDSTNTGIVGSDNTVGVGGIAGYLDNDSIVENNVNNGVILGNRYLGGIVGNGQYNATISDNTNNAVLKGKIAVGGIVGLSSVCVNIHGNTNSEKSEVQGVNSVGGIAGLAELGNKITDNTNLSQHLVGVKGIGGITGSLGDKNVIRGNSFSGAIKGHSNIGPVFGFQKENCGDNTVENNRRMNDNVAANDDADANQPVEKLEHITTMDGYDKVADNSNDSMENPEDSSSDDDSPVSNNNAATTDSIEGSGSGYTHTSTSKDRKKRNVKRTMRELGYKCTRVTGSHMIYVNDTGHLVAVPYHDTLKLGTYNNIMTQVMSGSN